MLVSFCLSGNNLIATEISIGDFLATAKNDLTLKNQEEKVRYLHSSSPNTPFLNRVELRTQTGEEFERFKQRHAIRFYPNGIGETKAGEKVYKTTVELNKVQQELLLHQALKERYILVINFLKTLEILKLKKELLTLYKDKISVFRKKVSQQDLDVNDLVNAEDDYVSLQLEVIELEATINSIEEDIRRRMQTEKSIVFNTENFADINTVKEASLRGNFRLEPDNIYLKNSSFNEKLAMGMYDLEKAEGKRYINFLETAYNNEELGENSHSFSFELGINLPFVHSNRLDVNRRKLQFLSEKSNREEMEISLEENLRKLMSELKKVFTQYDVLSEKKRTGKIESLLKKLLNMEGANPISLLEMKESILKHNLLLVEKHYEIYTKYLDLLDTSGTLSKVPLRNYISKNKERLKP